jgi:DoxX-like protein
MNLQATGPTIAAARPVTMPRLRTIIYWVVSPPVLLETAVGAEWDLARIPFVREIFAHLGYPLYLLTILGVAKLLAVIGLVTPRARRVKEWAYAGVFFVYGSRLLALRDRRWRRQDRDASCLRGVDVGVVRPVGRIA